MDLGPGPLTVNADSPFFLSTEDWRTMFAYAATLSELGIFQGLDPDTRNLYPQLSQIVTNLQQHYGDWAICNEQVTTLASDIAAWAALVPGNYRALADAAASGDGTPPAAAVSAVKAATDTLGTTAARFAQDAGAANTGIQRFLLDCQKDQTALNEYTQSPEFLVFQAFLGKNSYRLQEWLEVRDISQRLNSSDGPIRSLQTAEGVWTAIEQSLQEIARQVAQGGPGACSFLAALQLETAISEWTNLGAAANAFLSGQAAAA
jgi:hypothetical protein